MAPRRQNIVSRALSAFGGGLGLRADQTSLDLNDPRLWGGTSLMTSSGVSITPDMVRGLDVVASVLGRLAGTLSTMPLMVFERLEEEADADDDTDALSTDNAPPPSSAINDGRRPAKSHRLWKILRRRPNRRQTAQEFWAEMTGNLALWRNCYAEIREAPDGHPIGELWPIHPNRIVNIERRPMGDPAGKVFYQIASLDPGGYSKTLSEDQIFHVRLAPLRQDGLAGIPVFQSNPETFGRAIAVEQFGALYFANGGSGGGVLEHPGNFKTAEDRDRFLETWRMGGNGLNRHKDRLLLFGLKYTPFKVANDEAQFLETLKEMAVKVCRLWNMPPHLVGILDKATFSNIEQQSIEYVVHTIAPLVAAIEQAVGRDLLIGGEQDQYFVEFNLAGLLRGDFKTRMDGYAQARQWGWLSVNDIRRLENLSPIGAAGNIYLQPLNMADAANPPEVAQPTEAAPFKPTPDADPDESGSPSDDAPDVD